MSSIQRHPVPRLLLAMALVACNGAELPEDEESATPYVPVDFPSEVQSRSTAIAMRVTDAYPGEIPVNRSIVNILDQLEIGDLLTRGGVPDSPGGSPAELLQGTSIEQVQAYYDNGGVFPVEEAVDACGNPAIAAFVPPSQLQHATSEDPTTLPVWPIDCNDASCDTLEVGTLDAYVSNVRPDGKMDMVINLLPDTSTNPPSPGLYGHLIGYFLSANNPGFTEIPLIVNARQFTVALNNLWEQQKVYTDLVGARELYAFPGTERVVYEDEAIILASGNQSDWCSQLWSDRFSGVPPLGCSGAYGLLLDRNPLAGVTIYETFMDQGEETANLDQVVKAFEHAMRAYAVCPAVPDEPLYVQDGPVEFFLCPPEAGTVELCVAEVDMQQGTCEPRVGGTVDLTPETQAEPVLLAPQRFPYVLQPTGLVGAITGTDTGTTDTGYTLPTTPGKTKKDPFVPFIGTQVEVQLTVEADTVLFLEDPSALLSFTDAGGQAVELPEARLPCDDDDPTSRFDVGEAWGAGTYTLVLPWSATAEPHQIGLTSVSSWVW